MKLPFILDKQVVAEKLNQKGVGATCPSCSKNDWALLDHAMLVPEWINNLPAPGIPAAVMVCNNCGHIRSYALGALGLLPTEADENEQP